MLYLKVNLEKTTVSHVSKVKYLGYGFYRNKGKQVEQPRKRGKTQEIYDRVDQLVPVCRHEKPDRGYGQMAPPQNPSGVLEAMEEGAHQIQKAKDAESPGMEST